VYHIQVKEGNFSFVQKQISGYEKSFVLYIPIKKWFTKELLSTLILWYVIVFKIKKKGVFAYNFHIAYPLLTYSRVLTLFIRKPIFVTEHWSAYHFNFGVKKKLKRIQRIFKNKKLQFICVSKALAEDIMRFAETEIKYDILYNVVDEEVFFNEAQERSANTFFMLSYWKYPKDPFLILDVFRKLKEEGYSFHLKIGGFGPLMNEINDYIRKNNLVNECITIGKLNTNEIRREMNSSTYFIHNSNYETFSVVCAEALMCGTPVIASNVGGIKEYVNYFNGILILSNSNNNWFRTLENTFSNTFEHNHELIALSAQKEFSKNLVGYKYKRIIKLE
jgi:L-malate glycosyltransferase